MKRTILGILTFWFIFFGQQASATILFVDNFDDGDVSDWTVEYFGNSSSAANSGIEASSFDSVSDPYSLRTYFISEKSTADDNCYMPNDCGVRAVTTFDVLDDGDYKLDLFARSRNCSGCDMFYEIFNNGTLLASNIAFTFEPQTFDLSLTTGTYELKLGLRTTAAYNGNFQAFFDDVCVATDGRDECYPSMVPEPSVIALFAAGLFGIGFARRRRS